MQRDELEASLYRFASGGYGEWSRTASAALDELTRLRAQVPEGFTIEKDGGGGLRITAPGRIGSVHLEGYENDLASRVLFNLAKGLLSAAPTPQKGVDGG